MSSCSRREAKKEFGLLRVLCDSKESGKLDIYQYLIHQGNLPSINLDYSYEMKHLGILAFINLLYACLLTQAAHAQCPNYSWIVELHSKRRAINCIAAAHEINQVVESIIFALQSGRTVELNEFGKFSLKSNKESNKLKILKNKLKRVRFETSSVLTERVNEPLNK